MELPPLPAGIRAAVPADVPLVLALVRELAAYEREPDAALATEADLRTALFGDDPVAHCLIAEHDGAGAGMALWFRTFSTWTGRPGIHLEDLFVRPSARGRGLGLALVTALAAIAERNGWPRLEWAVLDWNTPAVEFYRSLGAGPMTGWSTFRLTGDALAALAQRAR